MPSQLNNSFILDTNAIISFVTDRNRIQQKLVDDHLILAVKNKEIVYCPVEVIEEFIYVNETQYDASELVIKDRLSKLIHIPQVKIISQLDISLVLAIWGNHVSDYVDAVLASISLSNQNIPILTFDKKFRNSLKKLNIPILPVKI